MTKIVKYIECDIMPTHAMIIKGEWMDDGIYGNVWCKIKEIGNNKDLSLKHPQYGKFFRINMSDCKFAIKKKKTPKYFLNEIM